MQSKTGMCMPALPRLTAESVLSSTRLQEDSFQKFCPMLAPKISSL